MKSWTVDPIALFPEIFTALDDTGGGRRRTWAEFPGCSAILSRMAFGVLTTSFTGVDGCITRVQELL